MISDPLLWFFAALGAFMVGVSKAGITGLSILSIALFNHVFPSSKQASGLVLPLLIFGDFVAVFSYRKHTQWHYLWRLFPWTAAGVVLGYFTLGRISDHTARILDRLDHRLAGGLEFLAQIRIGIRGGESGCSFTGRWVRPSA